MAPTPTTTTADAALLVVKRTYYSVPINLGNARTGFVRVRGDVMAYFDITEPSAATSGMKEVTRKSISGTVSRYGAGLADTSATDVPIDRNEKYFIPPRLGGRGGGRKIRLPTKLLTPKGNIRTAVITFPSLAINAVISDWLFANTKGATKPTYFTTERGTRYAVASKGAIVDLNPGRAADPTPV